MAQDDVIPHGPFSLLQTKQEGDVRTNLKYIMEKMAKIQYICFKQCTL